MMTYEMYIQKHDELVSRLREKHDDPSELEQLRAQYPEYQSRMAKERRPKLTNDLVEENKAAMRRVQSRLFRAR